MSDEGLLNEVLDHSVRTAVPLMGRVALVTCRDAYRLVQGRTDKLAFPGASVAAAVADVNRDSAEAVAHVVHDQWRVVASDIKAASSVRRGARAAVAPCGERVVE